VVHSCEALLAYPVFILMAKPTNGSPHLLLFSCQ
jgi:hypothetical protein